MRKFVVIFYYTMLRRGRKTGGALRSALDRPRVGGINGEGDRPPQQVRGRLFTFVKDKPFAPALRAGYNFTQDMPNASLRINLNLARRISIQNL